MARMLLELIAAGVLVALGSMVGSAWDAWTERRRQAREAREDAASVERYRRTYRLDDDLVRYYRTGLDD